MTDAKWIIVGTGIATITMVLGVTVPLLLGVGTDIRDINAWLRQHLTDHAGSFPSAEPPARAVHDLGTDRTDQQFVRSGGQTTNEALSNPPQYTSEPAVETLYSSAEQGNADAQANLGPLCRPALRVHDR